MNPDFYSATSAPSTSSPIPQYLTVPSYQMDSAPNGEEATFNVYPLPPPVLAPSANQDVRQPADDASMSLASEYSMPPPMAPNVPSQDMDSRFPHLDYIRSSLETKRREQSAAFIVNKCLADCYYLSGLKQGNISTSNAPLDNTNFVNLSALLKRSPEDLIELTPPLKPGRPLDHSKAMTLLEILHHATEVYDCKLGMLGFDKLGSLDEGKQFWGQVRSEAVPIKKSRLKRAKLDASHQSQVEVVKSCNGLGIMQYASNVKHVGFFNAQGVLHGQGLCYSPEGLFIGEFKEGLPQGPGKYVFKNGNLFEGTYDRGIGVQGVYSDYKKKLHLKVDLLEDRTNIRQIKTFSGNVLSLEVNKEKYLPKRLDGTQSVLVDRPNRFFKGQPLEERVWFKKDVAGNLIHTRFQSQGFWHKQPKQCTYLIAPDKTVG